MHDNHLDTLPSQLCGRRGAIRWAMALAIAGTSGTVQPAAAARGWCRTDPLVRIDGELVYIICSAPQTIRQKATGPTEIVVTVPLEVQTKLVAAGPNFGQGETIRFDHSPDLGKSDQGIDVQVDTWVPASEDLPVALGFAQRTRGAKDPVRVEGRTNSWFTLSTRFAPQQSSKKPRSKKSS